jgi:hypothetical protein
MEQLKEHTNLNVGVRILDLDHRQMAEVIHELKEARPSKHSTGRLAGHVRRITVFG